MLCRFFRLAYNVIIFIDIQKFLAYIFVIVMQFYGSAGICVIKIKDISWRHRKKIFLELLIFAALKSEIKFNIVEKN